MMKMRSLKLSEKRVGKIKDISGDMTEWIRRGTGRTSGRGRRRRRGRRGRRMCVW
jgi:hypothetical protein